eukprot:TRINITY_DN364_c0_g1_i1.p1 TRINITY_DN364_c0_g1~~TRINITY_DN364_c0_g1_i1.p1  ORF type:complete len:201 (-),score=73.87 TRINITY_DN364_c0_g1_i1:229-831(-)
MMKTMQNNNDIRKRLDFSSDDNKPKRQPTNIHMFLNQHQNKPKNFQSEPNMLKNTSTFTSQQDNTSSTNNLSSVSFNTNNTSPTKNQLPMPSTSEGNMNTSEQKYAGGGYSKSPNPKSLGKPGLQSPFKSNSPPKRENILNPNTSVPIYPSPNTSPVHTSKTSQQSNVLRFDSETFFKSVNTSNNNLLNPPLFNIHSNMK